MDEEELNNVMKFATGSSIIPALPKIKISMLVQPTSNINSGNSVENAIPIDALELSTDSYQNVNSNIPNVRQMVTFRWVNVTNPLERRTRRESAEF
ncbi:unnamed protein product [Rhizophagus irregularis]|nr:unnamed protein product [Rhizophagus irregularis]